MIFDNNIEENNSYISNKIKELNEYLLRSYNDEIEYNFSKGEKILYECFSIYTNSEVVLNQLVDSLSILLKKTGYCNFLEGLENIEFYEKNKTLADVVFSRLIDSKPSKKTYVNGKPTILFEFPNAKFDGILAFIGYNKFNKVMEKMITNVLAPYLNDFVFNPNQLTLLQLGHFRYTQVKNILAEFDLRFCLLLDNLINKSIKEYIDFEGEEKFKRVILPMFYGNEKEVYKCMMINLGNNLFATNLSLFKNKNTKILYGFGLEYYKGIPPMDEKKRFSVNVLNSDSKNDLAIVEINNYEFLYKSESIAKENIQLENHTNGENRVYLQGFNNSDSCVPFSDSFGLLVDNKNVMFVDAPFPPNIYGGIAYSDDGNIVGLVKTKKTFNEKTVFIPLKYIFDFYKKIKKK